VAGINFSRKEFVRQVSFICKQNRLRSPAAAQLFLSWSNIETVSTGLNSDADIPVSPELLEWAELIVVMQKPVATSCKTIFERAFRKNA